MKLIAALTMAAVSAGCSTPIVGADGYVDFERTFAQHRRAAPPAMPQMYTPPAPQQPYVPQTRHTSCYALPGGTMINCSTY